MAQPGGAPAAGPGRRVGVAVVALCLVQFMDVIGVTVVVTSLPAMLASLHAPDSLGSLIATGYAMFFGGLLMLGARLGDRYGHRRTILASLAVFAMGALVAAIAPSVLALAAGRCLQGAAAAPSVPSAPRRCCRRSWSGPGGCASGRSAPCSTPRPPVRSSRWSPCTCRIPSSGHRCRQRPACCPSAWR